MSTELHLVIVDGKVDKAAPQLEELFARVAVFLVLLDSIRYWLLGQTVLQLEGGHTGSPLMKRHRSKASWVLSWL